MAAGSGEIVIHSCPGGEAVWESSSCKGAEGSTGKKKRLNREGAKIAKKSVATQGHEASRSSAFASVRVMQRRRVRKGKGEASAGAAQKSARSGSGCFAPTGNLLICYNQNMTLLEDLKAYQVRWADVEAMIEVERQSASPVLRWQQLNAACALAIGLGMSQPDTGESEVFERWAKLKEKASAPI